MCYWDIFLQLVTQWDDASVVQPCWMCCYIHTAWVPPGASLDPGISPGCFVNSPGSKWVSVFPLIHCSPLLQGWKRHNYITADVHTIAHCSIRQINLASVSLPEATQRKGRLYVCRRLNILCFKQWVGMHQSHVPALLNFPLQRSGLHTVQFLN